jgi:exopolysaccharide biosynthesis predicted pyruvyltransferase EpsI
VGDCLIEDSALQLFRKFKINAMEVNESPLLNLFNKKICIKADEFAIGGGGSMGEVYIPNFNIRKKILKYGKPVTVLPQSFCNQREDLKYKKVFVRETESLKFREDAILVPDLALGYEFKGVLAKPKYDLGIWLRKDSETLDFCSVKSCGDPVEICRTPKEFIQLASLYKKIITDRLHFAIAGLIAKREVVLLPNSYFKNYSVWQVWLRDLGCGWADSPDYFLRK